jgi:hypothetical protein
MEQLTGEKTAPAESPNSEGEDSERRGWYVAAAGCVLAVASFLGWLGTELLPASTLAEKSLIIATCLLLGVASLTGYGAWRSTRRFAATTLALVLAVCLMGTLSAVAGDTAPGSPAPPDPTTTVSPATDSSSPSAAASGKSDKLVASYTDFELPCDYSMPLESGGRPQPTSEGTAYTNYDLYNICTSGDGGDEFSNEFVTDTGEVAVLPGGAPTFANCVDSTALGPNVTGVRAGQTICFQGHGVLAAAKVVSFGSSGGNYYTLLDVQVWQYPQADPQAS